MSFREETVSVRGFKTLVRTGGDGPVLVYLHSAGNEGWPPALELLAERHRVVAPVGAGFPGSDGLEIIDHVSDAAIHTLDLFEALGLERPAVMGSSLGGWLAAEMAARNPREVGPTILIDAAGLWIDEKPPAEIFGLTSIELADLLFYDRQHPAAEMLRAMALGFDDHGRPIGMGTELPPDEVLLPLIQAVEAAARLAWNPYLHDPKLERLLARVKSRTLVVWGKNDALIDPIYAERYRALIPGATVRMIDRCGHLPVVEKPEELASIVEDFLKGS